MFCLVLVLVLIVGLAGSLALGLALRAEKGVVMISNLKLYLDDTREQREMIPWYSPSSAVAPSSGYY